MEYLPHEPQWMDPTCQPVECGGTASDRGSFPDTGTKKNIFYNLFHVFLTYVKYVY